MDGADPLQPVVAASTARLTKDISAHDALQIVARDCIAQITVSRASLGAGSPESLHQVRVALRRWRTALTVFSALLTEEGRELPAELKWLAGQLNAARDLDVFATETLPPLAAAVTRDPATASGMKRLARTIGIRRRAALAAAREAVTVAETARVKAAEAAREASRALEPVSVLISRKTQRLYVRQAFEPVFDIPITVVDPDRPIGTHLFTAMEGSGDTNVHWSVVSLRGSAESRGQSSGHGRDVEPIEPNNAKAALDRIVIPQEALDRIPGIVPRSSLIITDEALTTETGKGTDFVVLLSGEPQGGIKFRRRAPSNEYSYTRPHNEFSYTRPREYPVYWRSPYGAQFSTW